MQPFRFSIRLTHGPSFSATRRAPGLGVAVSRWSATRRAQVSGSRCFGVERWRRSSTPSSTFAGWWASTPRSRIAQLSMCNAVFCDSLACHAVSRRVVHVTGVSCHKGGSACHRALASGTRGVVHVTRRFWHKGGSACHRSFLSQVASCGLQELRVTRGVVHVTGRSLLAQGG